VAERPFLLGLTGSIGMGKTETAKMFARLGIPVYDADAAVHALYENGGAAVEPIGDAFPGCVRYGQVDRGALMAGILGNAEAFAKLEAIVHPLVAEKQRDFIERAAASGADLVVLDIPLLFETGAQTRMDAVAVVSAPEEIQRHRVLAREGMTPDKLNHILARQVPDSEKRAMADFVVDTGQGLDHAYGQVRKIVEEIRARQKHA
jgi:dephospho-CoA kinase